MRYLMAFNIHRTGPDRSEVALLKSTASFMSGSFIGTRYHGFSVYTEVTCRVSSMTGIARVERYTHKYSRRTMVLTTASSRAAGIVE